MEPATRYEYRLEAGLRDGGWELWDRAAAVRTGELALRVRPAGPNPLRASDPLGVVVELPAPAPVRVTVHDVSGRLVDVLHDGRWEAGSHRAVLPAAGTRPRAGVYFVTVRTPASRTTTRLVVLD